MTQDTEATEGDTTLLGIIKELIKDARLRNQFFMVAVLLVLTQFVFLPIIDRGIEFSKAESLEIEAAIKLAEAQRQNIADMTKVMETAKALLTLSERREAGSMSRDGYRP